MREDQLFRSIETYRSPEAVRRFIEYHPSYRDGYLSRLICQFSKLIPLGAEVLDIGSGPGHDVALLRESGILALGIDISEPMVEYATAQYGPYFHVLDARDVSRLGENRFQGVLSVCSLIHLPLRDWSQVLKSIWKILRSRGPLLLTVKEGAGVIKDERLGPDCPRFVQLCTEEDLANLLRSACFKINDLQRAQGASGLGLHVLAEKLGDEHP